MSFAITGAHRSGKSTLAKDLSEALGIPYFEVSTTAMAKALGFDPVAPMTFAERLTLQEGLLEAHLAQLQQRPRPFIADRSTLDNAAYLLAEVGMNNVDPALWDRIERYRQRCMWAAGELYDLLLITRPLPGYEQRPDKPPANVAYQWHFQAIIEGMAIQVCHGSTASHWNYATVLTQDRKDRVASCARVMNQTFQALMSDRPARSH